MKTASEVAVHFAALTSGGQVAEAWRQAQFAKVAYPDLDWLAHPDYLLTSARYLIAHGEDAAAINVLDQLIACDGEELVGGRQSSLTAVLLRARTLARLSGVGNTIDELSERLVAPGCSASDRRLIQHTIAGVLQDSGVATWDLLAQRWDPCDLDASTIALLGRSGGAAALASNLATAQSLEKMLATVEVPYAQPTVQLFVDWIALCVQWTRSEPTPARSMDLAVAAAAVERQALAVGYRRVAIGARVIALVADADKTQSLSPQEFELAQRDLCCSRLLSEYHAQAGNWHDAVERLAFVNDSIRSACPAPIVREVRARVADLERIAQTQQNLQQAKRRENAHRKEMSVRNGRITNEIRGLITSIRILADANDTDGQILAAPVVQALTTRLHALVVMLDIDARNSTRWRDTVPVNVVDLAAVVSKTVTLLEPLATHFSKSIVSMTDPHAAPVRFSSRSLNALCASILYGCIASAGGSEIVVALTVSESGHVELAFGLGTAQPLSLPDFERWQLEAASWDGSLVGPEHASGQVVLSLDLAVAHAGS